MPQHATLTIDNASICLWKLTESPEQLLALLPSHLDYAAEMQRFRSIQRQREWLASRVMLHQTLGIDVIFVYDAHGAPHVERATSSLSSIDTPLPSVSVSHSGEWVAIVFDFSARPLGLDFEIISEKAGRVQHKFLTNKEAQMLLPSNQEQRPASSVTTSTLSPTALWCAKEATYKLCNTPGLLFLGQMILQQKNGQLLMELPTLQRTARLFIGEIENCAFALARWA